MFLGRNPGNAPLNDGRQEEGHIDKSYKARGKKRLQKIFPDPLIEVHTSFCANALPLFTHYYQFLQRSNPILHMVKPVTYILTWEIDMRLLVPDVLNDVTEKVVENKDNYLPLSSSYIVGRDRSLERSLVTEEGDIIVVERNKVSEAAQALYLNNLKDVLQKMQFVECFSKNTVWIDFCNRRRANWSNMMYEKILKLLGNEHDQLYEEFIDFKTISDSQINLN